jgi:MFS family permease
LALSYIDRSVLALLVEPVKKSLQLSDTQIGLVQGPAFGVVFSVLMLPFGWLADHGKRLRLIGCGMVFWSLVTAFCGLSANFFQLFLARMGIATGEAVLSPTGPSLIADYFPPERRTLPLSLYAISSGAGSGISLIAGGFVIGLVSGHPAISFLGLRTFEPWRVVFLTLGLPGVLFSLLLLVVRDPPRRDQDQARPTFRELAQTLVERRAIIAPHFSGFCVFNIFAFSFASWVPAFFMRVHGWSMREVGLTVGTMSIIAGLVGAITGGSIAGRFWRRGRRDANLLTAAFFMSLIIVPFIGAMWVESSILSAALLALAYVC